MATTPQRMEQSELGYIFNSLKPKQAVSVWFNSGVRSADDWTELQVGRKSKSKKYNLEKISLINPKNPKGSKYYLYNRQGRISFAMGDMGTSLIAIKTHDKNAETFEADPAEWKQQGLNHHGDLPFKEMDKIYKDARKERKYNIQHPKDGSKIPLSRRNDWEYDGILDDYTEGPILIAEVMYEDKSKRNAFYTLEFHFDLTNYTSPYKINPNDENNYGWVYDNFNFDPVNPRGYASFSITYGKDDGKIISSHRFKEMNAESFSAEGLCDICEGKGCNTCDYTGSIYCKTYGAEDRKSGLDINHCVSCDKKLTYKNDPTWIMKRVNGKYGRVCNSCLSRKSAESFSANNVIACEECGKEIGTKEEIMEDMVEAHKVERNNTVEILCEVCYHEQPLGSLREDYDAEHNQTRFYRNLGIGAALVAGLAYWFKR